MSGKGVHVVTVNDYLARRDAAWMGQIYEFLGLSVGCIVHGLSDVERRDAYAADVTYGTNNEFGFDYLRDNMKFRLDDMVQRPSTSPSSTRSTAILIDEARTPLIISGPAQDSSELYIKVNKLIPKMGEDDYEIDEKARTVTMTEEGQEKIEALLARGRPAGRGRALRHPQRQLVHHVPSRRCAPTSCSSATATTSSRTTRSSSSTSSPAA